MSNFMCKAVCWILAAGIAFVLALAIKALIAPGPILLFFMGLFIFIMLAFALPMLLCRLPDPVSAEDLVAKPVSAPTVNPAPSPQAATPAPTTPLGAPAASSQAASTSEKPTPNTSGSGDASWTDTVSATSGKAGPNRGATGIKPSVELAEEATVRDKVGSWRYESGASAYRASDSATPAADSAAPTAAGAPALEGDYDNDGVVEGKDEGAKPETLTAARDGKPDDLKQIKGVGPKMEGLLHSLGFFHFDQVASWSPQEVAWVDANLEGFKGRVSRDEWVAQAKVLATGGETEFSKRVEDGGVY